MWHTRFSRTSLNAFPSTGVHFKKTKRALATNILLCPVVLLNSSIFFCWATHCGSAHLCMSYLWNQVVQSLYICSLIPGASLASESKPVIRNESTYKYIFWVECPTIKPFKMVNYLFVPQYYNQNPLVGMWYPIFSNIEISSFYPTGWQYWQHVCNGTREHCQFSAQFPAAASMNNSISENCCTMFHQKV